MPQVEKTLKLLVFVIIAFVPNRSIAVVDRLRNSGSLKEQAEDRFKGLVSFFAVKNNIF